MALADLAVLTLTTKATLESNGSHAFSLWVVSAILLSPIVWIHYFVLLLIPFTQILFGFRQGQFRKQAGWAALASYLGIMIIMATTIGAPTLDPPGLLAGHILLDGSFLVLVLGYLSAYWLTRTTTYEPTGAAARDSG